MKVRKDGILEEARAVVRKTVDFTASQTAQTLWTPASGKKFVLTGFALSFTADDGVIHLFEDTDTTANRIWKFKGKDGGGASTGGLKVEALSRDKALKYTTAAGTTGHLTVYGYEV